MAGQISNLYSGNNKNWSKAVDELIKRRNDDAHGALIDDQDLKKELEERQKLLEDVLNGLSFYGEYRFWYQPARKSKMVDWFITSKIYRAMETVPAS